MCVYVYICVCITIRSIFAFLCVYFIQLFSSDSSTAIQDMATHEHGPTLFFTAGSAIQIWNLRMLVIVIICT